MIAHPQRAGQQLDFDVVRGSQAFPAAEVLPLRQVVNLRGRGGDVELLVGNSKTKFKFSF